MDQIFITALSIGALLITVVVFSYFMSLIFKNSFYKDFLSKWGMQTIFVFSLFATVGSLIMSVFMDLPPCDLCWYQRIFMYPILFISGGTLFKKDFKSGAFYSIILAVVGVLIAAYHYLIQISDTIGSSSVICSPVLSGDCSIPEFVKFGFVTIPYISLVAFIFIIISAYYVYRKN
jgi:disulfide bond formation protein DsbB